MTVESVTRVLAHRGVTSCARENTIHAFRAAAALGADGVELDVRRSSDGALVVHHDAVLADGRAIQNLTRAHLPDAVPALGTAIGTSGGIVNVEIKHERDDAQRNLAAAVSADPAVRRERHRVVISSFDRRSIDRVRELDSGLATGWLVLRVPGDAGLEALAAAGHSAVHPWVGGLTRSAVERCHAHGLSVHTWTVNDPRRMAAVIAWGVDAVITDDVEMALRVRG